jgi:hypothetical protein
MKLGLKALSRALKFIMMVQRYHTHYIIQPVIFFHPKNLCVARRAQFNAGETGQMSFGSWHQIVRLGQEGQKCGAASANSHLFPLSLIELRIRLSVH